MNLPPDPFRLEGLRQAGLRSPLAALDPVTDPAFAASLNNGNLPRWLDYLEQLPDLEPDHVDLLSGVTIGSAHQGGEQGDHLEELLRRFIPWRKGPFELFGVSVDSEWRSGMKWARLLPHIEPLAGRRVLDVGCGNGYHCWRSLGEQAELVIGVEPYLLYVMQFLAIKRYLPGRPCYLLPIALEDFPGPSGYFDTVFSMGVLYHVRSPIDHLLQLKKCLAPDGQLVLETLIVSGQEGYSLTPRERYARMSNVWFVPTVATLERWLQRCEFESIEVVDTTVTTSEEQRTTSWMPFESLADALDPSDPGITREGLPAPKRVTLIARSAAR